MPTYRIKYKCGHEEEERERMTTKEFTMITLRGEHWHGQCDLEELVQLAKELIPGECLVARLNGNPPQHSVMIGRGLYDFDIRWLRPNLFILREQVAPWPAALRRAIRELQAAAAAI